MAFTEFCCRSGGSNLNAGTLNGDSTEPGTSASFTYASGSWVQSTGVFTVVSGSPLSDGVAVGNFASVFPDAATVTPFVGRITAVDATTITVSLSAKSGTAPVDGTTNTTIKIGGAWKGPNGAEGFPFDFFKGQTLTNSSGNWGRVNYKNDATYSITSAITTATSTTYHHGYQTTYGDGGIAKIQGSETGTSFTLLTIGTSNFSNFEYLHFDRNGDVGIASGVKYSGRTRNRMRRCIFTNMTGGGIETLDKGHIVECVASNNKYGFHLTYNDVQHFYSCVAHNNTSHGYYAVPSQNRHGIFTNCISAENGGAGFYMASDTGSRWWNCIAYKNTGDGFVFSTGGQPMLVSCAAFTNGGWGVRNNSGSTANSPGILLLNCAFGQGTQANASGDYVLGTGIVKVSDILMYPADDTPWISPDTGNFTVKTGSPIEKAGQGLWFPESSYTGTVSYLDIGAVQSAGGGAARLLRRSNMRGGY